MPTTTVRQVDMHYKSTVVVLFDYHCTQILREVEGQATRMPTSPGAGFTKPLRLTKTRLSEFS